MILIGYDESERIAFRTGLYVIHFKRAKYADPSDALRGVVTAPARGDVFDSVSGRTRYDASFVAKVVADKVENAIPLERQARMFGNEGLPVAPSTLEDLYKRTADALQPLYERMVDRIMQCDILHADETFIKLMVKGAKKCKQAYMWCRLTGVGPPMIAFHFSPSRSRDVAKSLLGDYSGTIIRDSYVAYEKLDCEVACCWAHVRRRFLQAIECGYTKAEAPLKMIQALYQIEREAKARAEKKGTDTALFHARKEARRQSQKLVREFFEQCRVLKESERPSSLVAQAVSYALNIEEELKKFLKDSRGERRDRQGAERTDRRTSEMNSPYADIIHLPHHVSQNHPQMPMLDRAAQFAPFAALTGYEAAVGETARLTAERRELDAQEAEELNRRLAALIANLPDRPEATIEYFVPDDRKSGGAYVTVTGRVRHISVPEKTLVMEDGTVIGFEDIAAISGFQFEI